METNLTYDIVNKKWNTIMILIMQSCLLYNSDYCMIKMND